MTTVQIRKMDELRQVLKEAMVEDDIVKYMIDTLKMACIEDYVRFVSEARYEDELLTHILGKVTAYKDDLLQLSRMKTAWRVARATLNKTEQRRIAGQGSEDMDEPLDASTQDTLLKQWSATYPRNLAAWLRPADSLLGRIYREFQRNTPAVISIKKVKSLLIASRLSSEREVNLGGDVKLHLSDGVADGLAITTCVDHYWGLRILGYARSIVGQYKASSMESKGAQVVYAPLSVNMDYAVLCLKRASIWKGSEPLGWLRAKDEATRGRQVELMRMGWTQGEALQKALSEMKWNDQRGCASEKDCGKTHRCDVIKADGNTCGKVELASASSSGDVGQPKVVLVTKAMADDKSSEAGGLAPAPKVAMLPAGISNLSTNISALKPTQWCGKHPLPQVPWTLGIGVGTIYIVAVESDNFAREAAMRYLKIVVHVRDVASLIGSIVQGFLKKFPDGCPVLVGGTCPWSGRVDMRPAVFFHVPRIASEIETEIASLKKSNRVVKFVENVCGTDNDFKKEAEKYCKGGPVRTQAGAFGWVRRDRAWWGVGERGNMATINAKMPIGVTVVKEKGMVRLVWQGKKPMLPRFQAEGYFALAFVPEDKVSEGAIRRFNADNRRFPPMSYEPQSLMWSKQGAWRPPCPEERAALMMLPLDVVRGSQMPVPTWTHFGPEIELRRAVQGLKLDHAAQSQNVPAEAVALLQSYWVNTQMRGLPAENQGVDWSMQRHKHATAMGLRSQRGGPHCAGSLPALVERGVGKEAHMAFALPLSTPFDSENVMDDDALYAARAMARLGPYVRIWRRRMSRALEALAKEFQPWDNLLVNLMRPDVKAVAKNKKPAMMACLIVLLPWPDRTLPARYVLGFRLVGIIENSHLFRQLDKGLTVDSGKEVLLGAHALKVIAGLRDKLRRGRFLPEIKQSVMKEVEEGGAKGVYIENDLNFMFGVGGWLPLERFLHQHSCGKMRPIDNGKKYGHNKASLETETIYTSSPDFIAASARAFLTGVLVVLELQGHTPKGVLSCKDLPAMCSFLPEWSGLEVGTDDMKDAYRQCPNEPEDHCMVVIAFWDEEDEDVKYVILRGMPFGFSSAVINFNRTPALATAAARRLTGAMAASFFDDTGIVDSKAGVGSAQASVGAVYESIGADLAPPKRQPMASQRVFLGLLAAVGRAHTEGYMFFDVKPFTRQELCTEIDNIIADGPCSSGQASKLRGRFGWAATAAYGKCGRGGQAALAQRQYFDSEDVLTPELTTTLVYMQFLALNVLRRTIRLQGPPLAAIKVYSDASFEPPMKAKLGYVIFMNDGSQPIGRTAVISELLMEKFIARKTQITPCEAFCGVVVPFNRLELLRGAEAPEVSSAPFQFASSSVRCAPCVAVISANIALQAKHETELATKILWPRMRFSCFAVGSSGVRCLGDVNLGPDGILQIEVAPTQLSHGQAGVLLVDGTVICQQSSGTLSQQRLRSHELAAAHIADPTERQVASFRQALGLNRFPFAFKIGLALARKDLWNAMGRRCLECLDVGWAKKAYRQAPAPGMVLFLDRIQTVEDKQLLSGHVAGLLGHFPKAREYFLQSCCPEAALDMHCDFLQWDQALALAQTLAPQRLPDIYLKSALQLEGKGEHQQALTHYEQATRDAIPGSRPEHEQQCKAGIAKTSIRLGDLPRGMKVAIELKDPLVSKDCAQVLAKMKQYVEAAQLYEAAGGCLRPSGLSVNPRGGSDAADDCNHAYRLSQAQRYILDLNFEAAAPLMNKIHSPKLHLQYAKAKESRGAYREALQAYERARDLDSVVRLSLEQLNEPQKAFQLVRETQLTSGAERVAEYCRKNGNISGAVEFLLLAKNVQEAFMLAERQDEMATFEVGLGDEGTREQHIAIAKYYEQRNLLANAAKHYAFCEDFAMALKLYLKAGEKEIDHAIEVVGKARSDALTHTLIDYLMGESDNVPKDPNYVYRLHKALGNFMQAAGTALIIAKQEQEMGNYKQAHQLLFRTYQDLKSQKLALPQELWRRLMVLHSYVIVKRLVKAGDHQSAAIMLVRVAKNIQQFPAHVVPILTSVVIECQRAKMPGESYQYACTLMKPEYRPQVSEQYKKKIENIVRKPPPEADQKDSLEVHRPCMYCSFTFTESQLDCLNCKNISPFCIATGMRMLKDDWSNCPSCNFPARRSAFNEALQVTEQCPMCDAVVKPTDLAAVSDPSSQINYFKSLFQAAEGS
ncbi:unnamed protein product [Polarella glacialis]|uniref:Uncharacterized protein n=1 Tax=Polarella glacialis TaxID=89957 RepID=A0A813IA58_POLGL|nr:unnamed protein product [Polarella glacialis]